MDFYISRKGFIEGRWSEGIFFTSAHWYSSDPVLASAPLQVQCCPLLSCQEASYYPHTYTFRAVLQTHCMLFWCQAASLCEWVTPASEEGPNELSKMFLSGLSINMFMPLFSQCSRCASLEEGEVRRSEGRKDPECWH